MPGFEAHLHDTGVTIQVADNVITRVVFGIVLYSVQNV